MCSAQAKINKISYCSQSKPAPAAPTFQTLLSPHLPVRRSRTALQPRCCLWKLQLLRSLTQQLSPRLTLLSYVTTALHRRNNYHRRPTITQPWMLFASWILCRAWLLGARGLSQCHQPITGLRHTRRRHHSKGLQTHRPTFHPPLTLT